MHNKATAAEAFLMFIKWMNAGTALHLKILKHGEIPEQFIGVLHSIDMQEKQVGFAVAKTHQFLDIDLTAALFVVSKNSVEAERFRDRIVLREHVH
jgi:hypothetical protein